MPVDCRQSQDFSHRTGLAKRNAGLIHGMRIQTLIRNGTLNFIKIDKMKKTGMAKSDAKKLMGKMTAPGLAGFENSDVVQVDRREQRKRDAALGLVPFAVKINNELVQKLHALAKERAIEMNQLVDELLNKALAN